MKVDVYDTYAASSEERMIHFDDPLPDECWIKLDGPPMVHQLQNSTEAPRTQTEVCLN